jgi:hypothetical protein
VSKPTSHIDPSDPDTVLMEIEPTKKPRKDPREWTCDYCGAKCRDKVCQCGEVRP